MLSILIPTYNYNVFPLVENLQKQCIKENIFFEIIVLDDASRNQEIIDTNQKINRLNNCTYQLLPSNLGRSGIRNLLARQANYEWLLFLDADTTPVTDKLIAGYLPFLDDNEKVIYGGIKYQDEKPETNRLLRWIYGNEREALPIEIRKLNPYLNMLTLNFAIKKSVFEKVKFNESIPNLRYEDNLFSYELSLLKIRIEHINNPVYHLGLDTSLIFLKKTEDSLQGLKYLIDNKLLDTNYINLSKIFSILKKYHLNGIIVFLFKNNKQLMQNNLLGSKPSLFIFDLYRLGYLCLL